MMKRASINPGWAFAVLVLGASVAASVASIAHVEESEPAARSASVSTAREPIEVLDAPARARVETSGDALPPNVPLADVMRRSRLAFRASEQGHRGFGGAYQASLVEGRATLTASSPSDPDSAVEWTVATRDVSRGTRLLGARLERTAVTPEGALQLTRGRVEERWKNTDDGAEQSWSFRARPTGEGDVTVRVAASGLRHVASDEHGLHFADASGLGFRYGHATWIDAEGERTPVPATLEGELIALRVPAAVIERSSYPAVLDPIIGPETELNVPVPQNSFTNEERPAIASNGSQYLVVWGGPSDLVLGARVSPSGAVLDAFGFPIMSRDGANDPRVASNGTDFLVGVPGSSNVSVARVDASGAVLDPTPVVVGTGASGSLSLASLGGDYMAVWGTASGILGVRFTAAGVALDTPPIALVGTSFSTGDPVIDASGTQYFLSWVDNALGDFDIYGSRVTAAGVLLDSPAVAINTATGNQRFPRVASDGTDFLVTWSNGAFTPDIHGARVTDAGVLLDASPIVIDTGSPGAFSPDVTHDGTNYVVAWTSRLNNFSPFQIYAGRVTSAGAVLDNPSIRASDGSTQGAPRLASAGGESLVVGIDTDHLNDVYGHRVLADGTVPQIDGFSISQSGSQNVTVRVASNGSAFLATWQEDLGSVRNVIGTRVAADGAVLDPSGILIRPFAGDVVWPSVASNGTDYLVVWNTAGFSSADIHASRVTAAGVVVDTTALVISSAAMGQTFAGVASNGTDYLVAWGDRRAGGLESDIYGARVTAGGVIQEPGGIPISVVAGTSESIPAVGWNGTNYLVAFQAFLSSAESIRGARVSPAGAVLDASGFQIGVEGSVSDSLLEPQVGSDGSSYLVTWSERRSGTFRARGAVVSAAAGVSAAVDFDVSGGIRPYGAWDGSAYMIAWSNGGIRAARYDAALGLLDGPWLLNPAASARYPSIAFASAGEGFVVYDTTHGPSGYVRRAFGQTIQCTATDTTCDGIDDDCDGVADDDFAPTPTSCGVGDCAATGMTSCAGGVIGDDCTPGLPAADDASCNGVDDDCNGSVDEDYLTTPTTCGVGACADTGTLSCVGGSEDDSCTPGAPSATDATCDGTDDDCDGANDEDYAETSTTCGTGACTANGTLSCVGGSESDSCSPGTPAGSDASCDGVDDDCDTVSDEDFAATATSCGVGACSAVGTTTCVGGTPGDSCAPGTPAATDGTCNGIDDDCDLTNDEDYVSIATSCGDGACAAVGATSCVSGSVEDDCSPGTPAASDASCDGVDDDCDLVNDEDFVSTATACGDGVCAAVGSSSCTGGVLGDDCTAGSPTGDDDDCDDIDEDCDGSSDEGFSSTTTMCGVGVCESSGASSCSAGVEADSCVPGLPDPDDTSCDGVDDDCDGNVDEDGACTDAGPPDAGPLDAGAPDAGAPDAGAPDAGVPDAGVPDAGVFDAGSNDAGSSDAGSDDAGTPEPEPAGCGCRAAASEPTPLALVWLVAMLSVRRRRRARA